MTYQTLYRKYRSNTLDELVGQSHVIQTLTNAITHNRLGHAYIFSGPRGTGKTSTARILAKMVNQTTDALDDCPIGEKVAQGNCVDVIEIDAASHTGVDHMRQLTEQVQFLPVEAKTKVFIIDEVHMLSTGAFNALLKPFEEPPKNVIFILATTELHKIPATIQSRAQTLHFRLLDDSHIRSHVQFVCNREGVSIDDDALTKLVSIAKGGMRDALSLLDQLISTCENNAITQGHMAALCGGVDQATLIAFVGSCIEHNLDAISNLQSHIDAGIDVVQFYDDIVLYLHQAIIVHNEHPFSCSNQVVAQWLEWFLNQLMALKGASSPSMVATIGLYQRLQSPGVRQAVEPNIVRQSSAEASVKPQSTHTPMPKKAPIQTAPITTDQQPTPSVASIQKPAVPEPVPPPPQPADPSPAVGNQSPSVTKVSDQVLADMMQEFQVLKPVLKAASLVASNGTLYLILDETYQFFEKKLAEDKFKSRFLDAYSTASGATVKQWVVSSDVNVIHNNASESTSPSDNDPSPVEQKTINQIIEMFDAQVIK